MDLSKIVVRVLVEDFGKCFDFYTGMLGMEVTWGDRNGPFASFGKDGQAHFSMFLKKNMTMYEGYDYFKSSAADTAVIVIFSEDVDADYKKLKEKGVEFIGEPQTIEDWYMRCVYFRDPEGNLFEINQFI